MITLPKDTLTYFTNFFCEFFARLHTIRCMQHICRRWLHFRFLIKSFLANTLFSYKFLIVHFNASYTSSLCFCLYTLWYPVIILITRKIGTFKYRYGFSDPMNFVPAHFQPIQLIISCVAFHIGRLLYIISLTNYH